MADEYRNEKKNLAFTEPLDVDGAIEAARIGVWAINPVTNLVTWDDRCRMLFGVPESILQIPYVELLNYVHPEDVDRLNEAVRHALQPELGGNYDVTYRTVGSKDGLSHWVRFIGKTYFTDLGKPYRLTGIAQDMTQDMQLRQQFEASENRYRHLTDTVPAILWITEPDGNCTYLNKQWYAYTGQTSEEAEGFGWLDATHPDDKPETSRLFLKANQLQQSFSVLYRLRGKDGNFRWSLDKAAPRFSTTGTYEGMVGTVVDVHDQIIAEEDRQKLSSLIDASHEFVGLAAIDASVEYVNPAGLTMLGWDSFEGKRILDCIHPDDRLLAEKLLTDLLLEGHFSHEMRFLNAKTDEIFWLQWNAVALKGTHSDDIIGLATISANITERKKAEQSLAESETKLRSVIETAPAAIGLFVGRDLLVEMPNQAFIDIVGKGPDVVGRPLREVMPELESQAFLQILDDVYTSGVMFQSFGTQVDIVQHGVMTHNFYNITYTPLRDDQNNVYAILDIAIDVTEQIKAQQQLADSEASLRVLSNELDQQVRQRTQQLQDTIQDLSRSNENLQQFAYIASHDLQEPLRKIQSFGDILQNQYRDQLGEGVDYLQRMQAAASRMSVLIKDLLAFSRISTRQEVINPVSLEQVMHNVLNDLELTIAETGASISIDSLPIIKGDEVQLGQLFQNLLSNALKFRRAGTAPVIQISCRHLLSTDLPASVKPARQAPAYLCISVTDNGIGFDNQYRDRIFQVFQRLHGRSEFAGTGIGLAICERVATNHGGAITAHSQPGQGATFSVYLPE
ncbi:PAS domain S-box protein [Fibrella aquatica]|uniref:PAS domain S-box protein n=1 Tax=Fibrella aquatica TaxID=3242487 RepID=UPI00351FD1DF